MKDIKLKLLCLSLTFCAIIFSPAMATETGIVDALDDSVLEQNFDAGMHVSIVQEKDVELLSNNSQELEDHISQLESDLRIVISKINTVESDLKSLEITEADLKKYSSEKAIDVAEKEVYQGVSYDKDIYDHGKELADNDTQDFYSEYLEL
jgi:cell division protein FtsB